MTAEPHPILTIGHSNHSIERFIELLRGARIDAVTDVRSQPLSRWNPQFSFDPLRDRLRSAGIHCVFMGDQLGARPKDPAFYRGDVVDYGLLAESPPFQEGIRRLMEGRSRYRIALMCAEKEPLECHRTLLVARELQRKGVEVAHILADGRIEPVEDGWLRLAGGRPPDLFAHPDGEKDRIESAIERQIARVTKKAAARATPRAPSLDDSMSPGF